MYKKKNAVAFEYTFEYKLYIFYEKKDDLLNYTGSIKDLYAYNL